MNKIVLLKDQAGVWWMGSVADSDGLPNPIMVEWPQLFIEQLEDPRLGKVKLGLGSPFASFRLPAMAIAWTALMRVAEIENHRLCQMYAQAVQNAKGTGIKLAGPTDVPAK